MPQLSSCSTRWARLVFEPSSPKPSVVFPCATTRQADAASRFRLGFSPKRRTVLDGPPRLAVRSFKSLHNQAKVGCEFETAVFYLGKPKSQSDLEASSTPSTKGKQPLYQAWVEEQKSTWIHEVLDRQRSQLVTGNGIKAQDQELLLRNSGHDWWFTNLRSTKPFPPALETSATVATEEARFAYMGVADGVGGWEEERGVDPSQVSQSLMYYSNQLSKSQSQLAPAQLITRAYSEMLSDGDVRGGASTALIARLDRTNWKLDWSNLGDSSLMVFKQPDLKLSFATTSQTHFFNCPYQLSKLPNQQGIPSSVDCPAMAESGSIDLEEGDVVLLSTDGLVDNLWPAEITGMFKCLRNQGEKYRDDAKLVQDLAYSVVTYARMVSLQPKRVTPFEVEARKHSIHDLTGGKVDDITLIVSLVKRQDSKR